ncbi:DUF1003 domain-containing protein [Blastopirellula sp. J2-11]|uniref:DUF1003 domain-containing protein n=1 Tax=Blastopirellula sp. J2-11 TaxID=2943192 RepID=UPI0021C855CC|nr:DUF1003 domain-containing protein [Blastopirellula sp. J2-11]UUO06615.1 DUF1003 domain-containing protein [Blastopirellula sp. J2-11]
MAKRKFEIRCDICGKSFSADAVLPADLVRASVGKLIEQACPAWNDASHICVADLNRFRADYVQHSLETERGELSVLEDQVVESLRQHEILAENPDEEFEEQKSLGQRLADRVASFGGSWTFILLFGAVLVVWIMLNSITLLTTPFDPFPFILLNLVLSCLAAIQAPVIMMSQNRQEAKDRLRAEHDYRVNLKAELEIRHLHSKLDLLLTHQWQRLLEIQQLQTDLLEEIASRGSGRS